MSFLANNQKYNLFFLAWHLGITVRRLKHELTHREMVEWLGWIEVKNYRDAQAQRKANG